MTGVLGKALLAGLGGAILAGAAFADEIVVKRGKSGALVKDARVEVGGEVYYTTRRGSVFVDQSGRKTIRVRYAGREQEFDASLTGDHGNRIVLEVQR